MWGWSFANFGPYKTSTWQFKIVAVQGAHTIPFTMKVLPKVVPGDFPGYQGDRGRNSGVHGGTREK